MENEFSKILKRICIFEEKTRIHLIEVAQKNTLKITWKIKIFSMKKDKNIKFLIYSF